jgi:hypothetical protein
MVEAPLLCKMPLAIDIPRFPAPIIAIFIVALLFLFFYWFQSLVKTMQDQDQNKTKKVSIILQLSNYTIKRINHRLPTAYRHCPLD